MVGVGWVGMGVGREGTLVNEGWVGVKSVGCEKKGGWKRDKPHAGLSCLGGKHGRRAALTQPGLSEELI